VAVDFDALNKALGHVQTPNVPPTLPPPPPSVGESQGRSSAHYASVKPHPVPATRAPNEDLNAPAVILAPEVTQPGVTVPNAPPMHAMAMPHAAMQTPMGPPVSGPHMPGSTPNPHQIQLRTPPQAFHYQHAHTPGPFPVQGVPPHMTPRGATVQMDVRPRRGRSPTVVVRRADLRCW